MIRTNSRQAKEKIKTFIGSIFDASNYEREDLNNASIEEKIAFIARICWEELGFEVKKNRASFQDMFISWCEGLPSLINTASYYCHASAVKILGDILEETEEERARFDEVEAEKMLSYLIYKEVASDLFKIAY